MKFFTLFFSIILFILSFADPVIIGFSDDGKYFGFYYETDIMGNFFSEIKIVSLENNKLILYLKLDREKNDYTDLKDVENIFYQKFGENFKFNDKISFVRYSGSLDEDNLVFSNGLKTDLKIEYEKKKNEYGTYSYNSILKQNDVLRLKIDSKVIDIYSVYVSENNKGVIVFKSREYGLEGEYVDSYHPFFLHIDGLSIEKDVEKEMAFNVNKAKNIMKDFYEKTGIYPQNETDFFRFGKVLINPVDQKKPAVIFRTKNLKYDEKYNGSLIVEYLERENYYNMWYFLNGNIVKVEGVSR